VVPTGIAPAAANQVARGAASPPTPVGQAVAPRTEAAELAASVVTANADELAALTIDSARAILGAAPVTIPGVPVRRIGLGGPGTVVVEQALDERTVVRLYERRSEAMQDVGQEAMARQRLAAPAPAASRMVSTERLARYVGPLRVEIAGPVGADSLSKLLERVR
jgi:hypothetical protein